MKFKKQCLSTELSDLYGRDNYQSHIKVGREYWYYFSRDIDFSEGWYKIKITYVRSGCVFYVFSDMPEIGERYFPANCFMASALVYADINPIMDLEDFGSELEKKMYRFDDERTIVYNWPNEKEIELDENKQELDFDFLAVKIICEKINE